MELFKGSLHYRCALSGFVPTPSHPTLNELPGLTLSKPSPAQWQARPPLPTDVDYLDTAAGRSLLELAGGRSMQHLVKSHRPPAARALQQQMSDSERMAYEEPYDTGITCSPADPHRCAAGTTSCEYFVTSPMNGIESFDSVPLSFISLMQAITFDEWNPHPLPI